MAIETVQDAPTLTLYDRRQALLLLRDSTPYRLRADLHAGRFGAHLNPKAAAQLDELLLAWEQRALGLLHLRDVMLIDHERGPQVYDLICTALTVERILVPQELAAYLTSAPSDVQTLPAPLSREPLLAQLAERARQEGLAIAWQSRPDRFPPPGNLDVLKPLLPRPDTDDLPPFEPPTGWRKRIAAGLAAVGVLLLVMPLLSGRIPESPARLPLALLTLALMIGIRAGPGGMIGAACIWLVANLPGFRHGLAINHLWPAPLFLSIGLILLSTDRYVRSMWRWLRQNLLRYRC